MCDPAARRVTVSEARKRGSRCSLKCALLPYRQCCTEGLAFSSARDPATLRGERNHGGIQSATRGKYVLHAVAGVKDAGHYYLKTAYLWHGNAHVVLAAISNAPESMSARSRRHGCQAESTLAAARFWWTFAGLTPKTRYFVLVTSH